VARRAEEEACGRMMGVRTGGGARATGMMEQGAAASPRRIGRRPMGAAHGQQWVGGFFYHYELPRRIWSTIPHPAIIHMKSNGYKKG
jgi:hypothetical protein